MSENGTLFPAAPALSGTMFIGHEARSGSGTAFRALAALDGRPLEPPFANATAQDVERACILAAGAFDTYRCLPLDRRAGFLEAIAQEILDLGEALIERAMTETGLPRLRLEGERGRTIGQLKMFAEVVRGGGFLGVRIDPALPDRMPLPRPDLRLMQIPLGPVAVFGASNFPLAFSVAGGDAASALAAGCPVVVKGHPAHPGTSELVAGAVVRAAQRLEMPEGVFSYLVSDDRDIAQGLVADPRIKAVGFTGSRAAGMAIYRTAHARPEPIPVYAEMSAINPVVLMPGALTERAESIAEAFVAALTMGAGQFCTNPGLALAVDGPDLKRFQKTASNAVRAAGPATMLTPTIRGSYEKALEAARAIAGVESLSEAPWQESRASAALLAVDAETFLGAPTLREEIFGPASLIVRCQNLAQLRTVLESLDGQLTASIHAVSGDHQALGSLLPLLERKAGRILFDGFGTGVEVSHAMVHGGPFPATSDARTTSVGSMAIDRFLRPVSYQNFPADLMPAALGDANPLNLDRLIDGARHKG